MGTLSARAKLILHQSWWEFGSVPAPCFAPDGLWRSDLLSWRSTEAWGLTSIYARLLPRDSPEVHILNLLCPRVMTARGSLSAIYPGMLSVQWCRPPDILENASSNSVLMSERLEVRTVPLRLVLWTDLFHPNSLFLNTLDLIHETLWQFGFILQFFQNLASMSVFFVYFFDGSHESPLSQVWTHEGVVRVLLNLLLLAWLLEDWCRSLMWDLLQLLSRSDVPFLGSDCVTNFGYLSTWIRWVPTWAVRLLACNIGLQCFYRGLLLSLLQFLKHL